MGKPRWFLADLRSGRRLLDLPVLTGRWQRFLNRPETLTCMLDMQDPDVIQLRPRIAAAPARSILACAVDDVVLAAGPVWAQQYTRTAKTLQLTAMGMWSYFDHRYVLPVVASTVSVSQFAVPDTTAAGKTKPNPAVGTYLTGLEYGTIAKRWVQQARAWTSGDVPIVFEADRAGTHERNFEGADFKNIGTVLTQLSQIENGPDIRFRPRLTPDMLGIEFLLETGTDAAPLLAGGTHLWDLTAPASPVSNFSIDVDGTQMASIAWATAGRSADTVLVARATDRTLTDAGYPLLETLDSSHTTVSEQATLNGWANEAAVLGRRPVETWDFDVEANSRPYVGSFWEGDWCEIRSAAYDPATGIGDPYLIEKQASQRRITYLSGDQDGLVVSVKTMERV
ncbi:hypothetical protein [uncultured Microbacterium sp.]|uniref:hypothetical protein n=1 Tax=uncultured Microbacterium sp. TaxID=191216 RepID=UPI0025E61D99|nr:hypothetical protein [uncultured Microbacterium sp.]